MQPRGEKPSLLEKASARLAEFIPSFYPLIFSSAIEFPAQYRRMTIIQSRILYLAWVMAIGTPLWSVLDAWAFPEEVWKSILMARLLAGAAFASFLLLGAAILRTPTRNMWVIYGQLVTIFAIPALFYVFCHRPPELVDPNWLEAAVASVYHLLPLVILACIGFFPLTVVEAASFAAPLMAAFYFSDQSSAELKWAANLGTAWTMLMMAAIAIVISLSQLRMLIQLVDSSAYDAMTTCLGRNSGEEIVKSLWHAAVRKKAAFCIALFDLDHFKKVNDNFGHQVGDLTLTKTALIIKKSLRKSDFVIRWGGEEFLVVLSDVTIDNANKVLMRMMNNGFGQHPDGTPQTVSIGVAERLHDGVENETSLIQIADQRLYRAKVAGRGRIVSA